MFLALCHLQKSMCQLEKKVGVSARQAYFSHGWSQSGRISTLLEQFFESASSFSKEISGLKRMLLHPPSSHFPLATFQVVCFLS